MAVKPLASNPLGCLSHVSDECSISLPITFLAAKYLVRSPLRAPEEHNFIVRVLRTRRTAWLFLSIPSKLIPIFPKASLVDSQLRASNEVRLR